jgi:N-acetylmuramic acid 6-phosphate etherase
MRNQSNPSVSRQFLGIECGGTRSISILAPEIGKNWTRIVSGPANLRLLNDEELERHFLEFSNSHGDLAGLASIAIGMAGARTEVDRQRIRTAAAAVWPGVPCYATNDLETALVTAEVADKDRQVPRVLILSGTGSCCFGRTPEGKTLKVGGWGHLLGDKGSGYEIGLRALKAVIYHFDRDGVWPDLGQRVLRSLQLNEPDELISWAQNATKAEIAALSLDVFAAKRDKIASDILSAAARILAEDGATCAKRLLGKTVPVQFVLAGGVLTGQPAFARRVRERLLKLWPRGDAKPLKLETAWGAVELARRCSIKPAAGGPILPIAPPETLSVPIRSSLIEQSFALSPTEQRNPLSANLDQLPLSEMIALVVKEEAKAPEAVLAERRKIERAIRMITRSFQQRGRLFYVGAGTSGRLGVLDASECPPTFRTSPELVQGLIAGGQTALWKAVEGAEDDPRAGENAIGYAGVNRRDVVVGITASGRTPFVWGALREAKRRKANTILLCFNPHLRTAPEDRPDLVIAPDVGPEILTGSTRLKAGTATKLILNTFTTLAMVRLGKVISNLMVDLHPTNTKLRERAVRIVQLLTGANAETAHKALVRSKWVVKDACKRLR